MSPRQNIDRDENVIALWHEGMKVTAIGERTGLSIGAVGAIVSRARQRGDLRAVARYTKRQIYASSHNRVVAAKVFAASRTRYHTKRLAKKHKLAPISQAELAMLVAQSSVAVTKLSPGAHLGWRPTWFKA